MRALELFGVGSFATSRLSDVICWLADTLHLEHSFEGFDLAVEFGDLIGRLVAKGVEVLDEVVKKRSTRDQLLRTERSVFNVAV